MVPHPPSPRAVTEKAFWTMVQQLTRSTIKNRTIFYIVTSCSTQRLTKHNTIFPYYIVVLAHNCFFATHFLFPFCFQMLPYRPYFYSACSWVLAEIGIMQLYVETINKWPPLVETRYLFQSMHIPPVWRGEQKWIGQRSEVLPES